MSEQQGEAQLSLKDRLNFPYLLANQILTFQKSVLAQEFSEREIIESIKGFIYLIPENWKDSKFEKQIKKAKKIKKIDKRPIVAGRLRVDEATCKELGIPAFVEEKIINYYLVFQACINLLDRKKLLSRVRRIEKLEGIDFEQVKNKVKNNAVLKSKIQSKS